MDNDIYISNIQRCCFQDGPGIRTTVFLKGCSVHCPWCANPENICSGNQYWFDEARCVGELDSCIFSSDCSRPAARKKRGQVCSECEPVKCPMGAFRKIAFEYSIGELEEEILKDRVFWEGGGGVTFSGGEPLLWAERLEPMLVHLQELGIDICFETALFAEENAMQVVLRYATRLYVDMKILEQESCKLYLGGDIRKYLSNMEQVASSGIPYTVRIPLVRPYTYYEQNLRMIRNKLKEFKVRNVQIFACHNMGNRKYAMLGRKAVVCGLVTEKELFAAADMLGDTERKVEILRLG